MGGGGGDSEFSASTSGAGLNVLGLGFIFSPGFVFEGGGGGAYSSMVQRAWYGAVQYSSMAPEHGTGVPRAKHRERLLDSMHR